MYLVNTRIPFKTLRVVKADGEQVGVISKAKAPVSYTHLTLPTNREV